MTLVVYALNAALSLVMGIALWAVWLNDKKQVFVRSIAGMNLAGVPLLVCFWIWKDSIGMVHLLSGLATVLFGAAVIVCIGLAVLQLAHRKIHWGLAWLFYGCTAITFGIVLSKGVPTLAGIFNLLLFGLLGVYTISRMWNVGVVHRIIGFLLILMGLNALNVLMGGENGPLYQYSVGSVIRVGLAMAFAYAAFTETQSTIDRMRVAFEQLSDHSLQGIAVISGNEVKYANPALLKMFGYANLEEASKVGPWAAVLNQRKYSTPEEVQAMFEGSRHFFEVERDALRADGNKIHIQLSSWSTLWEGQPAVQFVVVDHTAKHAAAQQVLELKEEQERQRAEFAEKAKLALLASNAELEGKVVQRTRELEEASRAKSLFLANMSHEIRTPMNAILGMLQLLQGSQLSGRQAEYALKAQGAAKALLRLLNDILDFSKIDAGKMRLEAEPFAVEHMLRDLKVLIAGAKGAKPIDVVYDIDPAIPKILVGDATRLLQVMVNLCSNAIKFTAQGHVTIQMHLVQASEKEVTLNIQVSDTGIGIAPEHQAHIFEIFSQAEASTTRRFGGTGLGLSICRHLLALMGSKLELKSQLGHGSTFHFVLTLDRPDLAHLEIQETVDAVGASARLQGVRILLVEDNHLNQLVARELLQNNGAQVDVVDNGRIAVDYMISNPVGVDVILMDMQMPEMDGCEATMTIRQKLGNTQTPIIAMTANSMPSDREACLAAGMNDHVGKPFEIGHLINVVCKHLGRNDQPGTQEPVPTVAAKETPLLDLESALQYMGGDRDLFGQLLDLYRDDLKTVASELQTYWEQRDLPAAHKLLHTFKGTSATVGAIRLSREAQRLEQVVKQNSPVMDSAMFLQVLEQTRDALGPKA